MAGNAKTSTTSGKTTSGKGSGKIAAKRKAGSRSTKPLIQGITKGAIRRLARRGGVKRISYQIYEYSREVLINFMEKLVRDSITYTEHGNRKTVTTMDVIHAMKRQGKAILGFHTL
jgi:histone H4